LGLAAEADDLLGAGAGPDLEHLESDDAAEILVERLVDDPHPARAQRPEDLVLADAVQRARGQFAQRRLHRQGVGRLRRDRGQRGVQRHQAASGTVCEDSARDRSNSRPGKEVKIRATPARAPGWETREPAASGQTFAEFSWTPPPGVTSAPRPAS